MKLTYTFEGINSKDGQFPRGMVAAQFPLDEVPRELANFTVKISFPINDLEAPVSAVAQRALAAARSLLNESVAVQWVSSQPLGSPTALADPPNASDLRLGTLKFEDPPQ